MKKKKFFKQKTVLTSDPAYFMGEEVSVTLTRVRKKNALTSVSVWGPDDIGMMRFFDSFDEAKFIFDSIVNGINKKMLLQHRFEQD